MKTLKSILTAFSFVLFLSVSVFANKPEVVNNRADLRATITELVKNFDFNSINEKSIDAKVTFSLRQDGEIILLDTGTRNYRLHEFLKTRINHQMINIGELKPGTYSINLEFKLM